MELASRVRAAQRGDVLAMSALLDELAPWVGRLCAAIALDDGADAAQEALIQVFRELGALRDPERLRPWVRRISTREALRHARRARREPPSAEAALSIPARDDPELVRDVSAVLRRLSPEQRAILVLRDLEGFSESEAAAQLGVALGTVKSRLHRARAAFVAKWEKS